MIAKLMSDAMENRAMSEAVGLAEKRPNFSLSSLFENRVTEECLAIFNINGTSEIAKSPC